MKYILIFLVFLSCKNSTPDTFKRTGTDTVFTTANIAFDVISGEYKTVTALKIRFDGQKLSKNDSTRVEWFRDSSYQIRLSTTAKDSAGRFIYDSLGVPKKVQYWQQVDKQFILEDYNKEWPLQIEK